MRFAVCMCVCALVYVHKGLWKIIVIDLRRGNVEMLPDGTFSCEWLQMRRVILERPGQSDTGNAHQNTKCCPSLWMSTQVTLQTLLKPCYIHVEFYFKF